MNKNRVLLLLLLAIASSTNGQMITNQSYFSQYDKGADSSTLTMHSLIRPDDIDDGFQWISPETKLRFNSHYPRGYNDGPTWYGRGLTLEAQGGFYGKKGNFSFVLNPLVFISQNDDFFRHQINPNVNEFNYQYSRGLGGSIDFVQQYGNSSLAYFHLNQTNISFETSKVHLSLSTMNYNLGPAYFNPIILSTQAGGFPHLRIGNKPSEIRLWKRNIGTLETNFIVGLLKDSKYFDSNNISANRYFNGLFLGFSPNFLPELTVGFNKVLYKSTEFFEAVDLFSAIKIVDDGVIEGTTLSPNDTFDQLASLTVEWNFESIGFRAYTEFAKNDFSGPLIWTLLEPEHSRGYTVGFEKITPLRKGVISIIYEHTNISKNHTRLYRASPTFYAHGVNKQGYTHNGQILGAGIGPGGNSDHFGLKIKKNQKLFGVILQRIEFNKDYFLAKIQSVDNHDVEYSLGAYFQKQIAKMVYGFDLTLSKNYNRYFLEHEPNISIGIQAQYLIFKKD